MNLHREHTTALLALVLSLVVAAASRLELN